MKEVTAYTGDFDPDLKLENFSKEVLVKYRAEHLGGMFSHKIGDDHRNANNKP